MRPAEIDLSIILVNWNTRDLLLGCLKSIAEHCGGIPHEVIVVDNASGDGSADAVRRDFPGVKLIASDRNLGFAAGNNLGLREARGEFVLFLNPDTVVLKDAVQKMLHFIRQDPEVGVVGCKLIGSDGRPQESYWMEFPDTRWLLVKAFYLDKLLRLLRRRTSNAAASPVKAAHILGACMLARTNVVKEIGGFDASYFLYLEETDLCYRLAKAGYAVYYLPAASIVHIGQQSSLQGAEWTSPQLYASTYAFISKRTARSVFARGLLKGAILICALVRSALWSYRFAVGRPDRTTARKMLRGYFRLVAVAPTLGTDGGAGAAC